MRNPFFDCLKFVAILLVVYGHVASGLHCSFGRPYVSNFIIGMNMPIFFIISGYFSSSLIRDGNWTKLFFRLIGYFQPVLVVSVFFSLLTIVFSLKGCSYGFVGYAIRYFIFPLWYLWCLSICLVVTFLCFRMPTKLTVVGALVIAYFVSLALKNVWQMGNVRAMIPFFLFGLLILRRWELWRMNCIGASCLLVYLCFVFFQGDIHQNGLSFYDGDGSLSELADLRGIIKVLGRFCNGIIGCVGVMWVVDRAVKLVNVPKYVLSLGTTTLGVYVLHQWMLNRALDFCVFGNSFVVSLVGALCLFLGCHMFTLATREYVFLKKFFWGQWNA